MEDLYHTLHSGSVKSLHWVFDKVACYNNYLHNPSRQDPVSSHQLSHLVHLLNGRVSKISHKSIQHIVWWQRALDREGSGTRKENERFIEKLKTNWNLMETQRWSIWRKSQRC